MDRQWLQSMTKRQLIEFILSLDDERKALRLVLADANQQKMEYHNGLAFHGLLEEE